MCTRSWPICLLLAACASAAQAAPSSRLLELMKQVVDATPRPEHGQQLYAQHCASCHGAQGWGAGSKGVPALAAQRESYLLERLIVFASLERYVPQMHGALSAATGLGAQGFRDVAAYLAHQPRGPTVEHGDGRSLAVGAEDYAHVCLICHGRDGEGSESEAIPAIAGQHYTFVLAQLSNFGAGHRAMVEPPVIDFAGNLSPEERAAVADYVSRLTVPPNGGR